MVFFFFFLENNEVQKESVWSSPAFLAQAVSLEILAVQR